MPLAVVDARLVVGDDGLAAAQVVEEDHVAVAEAQADVVAARAHLLLTVPEDQAVGSRRPHLHLDVYLATSNPEITHSIT